MMIIASEDPLAVGERKEGYVCDLNLNWKEATFIVIRERTYEEYVLAAIANGASEANANEPFEFPHRFYEIATD